MDAGTREFVRQRARHRCEYCRLPDEADKWPFHVDHIVASQHGGTNVSENLCWACSRCNLFKGPNLVSINTETGRQVALFHPRTQHWEDHFAVHEARIVGLTETGRVTALLLRMNDTRRVELRNELIEQGLFEI
jgi:5-methylcytosine-specific restriction endonuclease McrA